MFVPSNLLWEDSTRPLRVFARGSVQGADAGSQVTHSANSRHLRQRPYERLPPGPQLALHPHRWATNQVRMVATKVYATTVPKTLDIAATLVLLLYLLFIGLHLISPCIHHHYLGCGGG